MWLLVQGFTGEQYSIKHKTFFLGICGPTCSGKTEVSLKLLKIFKDYKPYLFSMDMYYKSLPEGIKPEEYNFDSPSALDFPLIMKNLKNLEEKRVFKSPLYDFKTHKRISYKTINPETSFIIIEGIFLLYFKPLRDKLNFKVYLEAEREEILKRRILRDKKIRGSSINFIKEQMEKFVFPSSKKYVEKYKNYANLVLPSSFSFQQKIKVISKEVNKNLLKYWNEI